MSRTQKSLFLMGIICLVLSAIHIPWLWSFESFAPVAPLTEAQLLSFQLLAMAVMLFLAFMGINSLMLAFTRGIPPATLKASVGLLLAFFVCRIITEFVFPLQIPLLGVEQPTTMVKILLTVPIAVLLFPILFPGEQENVANG